MLAVPEFILQQLDGTPHRMAPELNDTPIERDAAVHGREQAERALPADIRGLDRRAILQRRGGLLVRIGAEQPRLAIRD